jgi:hypothetical protein
MGAGKGDKPRPVDKKVYDSNFDNINWNKPKKDLTPIKSKGTIKFVYKTL